MKVRAEVETTIIRVRQPTAYALILISAFTMLPAAAAATLPINATQIDRTVARAMHAFHVAGLAVGVVKDGELVLAKGFGVPAIRCTTAEDFEVALSRALASPGPYFIEAIWDVQGCYRQP